MGTLLDVLRALVDGVHRLGGIGEDVRNAAHDVINEHDTQFQADQRQAEQFSEADRAELERLQAKAAAASTPAEPEPEGAIASPLLTGGNR